MGKTFTDQYTFYHLDGNITNKCDFPFTGERHWYTVEQDFLRVTPFINGRISGRHYCKWKGNFSSDYFMKLGRIEGEYLVY